MKKPLNITREDQQMLSFGLSYYRKAIQNQMTHNIPMDELKELAVIQKKIDNLKYRVGLISFQDLFNQKR